MKLHSTQLLFALCFLLVACYPSRAQDHSEDTEDSCRRFAQGFYDWYVPQVFKVFKVGDREAPWHVALKYKGDSFSRELARSLKASDAEAKAEGDPVLDFEPILNTQDPAEHYAVRTARVNHNRCLADVYGVWSRAVPNNGKAPNVVAELVFEKGRWVFVNFHYPDSGNLPSVDLLKVLGAHYKDPQKKTK
jgi:hypothetical protein